MREHEFKTYLLGIATESERTAIDRSLLTNDDVFEQVLLAEDDLIEAYLRDKLTADEVTHFEQCFLADPERQQKLRLAKALHRYANDPSKSLPEPVNAARAATPWWAVLRRPAWQLAMASVLLVAALLSLKAVFNPAASDQLVQSRPSPSVPLATTAVPAGTEVLPVELFPGVTRAIGTTIAPVNLSPQIGTVQFKLQLLKASYSSYEVTLKADDEEGQKLTDQVKPQITKKGSYVIVPVPVTALGTGGYQIRLDGITPSGTEKAGSYSFTVNR